MSKTLTFLDKSFWITESDDNPKHVATLQLLELPDNADCSEYVPALFQEIRGFSRGTSPFNCSIKTFMGYPTGFRPVKTLNMDYHTQLHKIDDVTDRVVLDNFVAKLHETRLDPDKPLWQFHFIYDGKIRATPFMPACTICTVMAQH